MPLNLSNFTFYSSSLHPYHLVDPSPWPLLLSFSTFQLLQIAVFYMHDLYFNSIVFILAVVMFFFSIISWFYDIVIEGTYEGHHTVEVQNGLRIGFALFIVSEAMFFFSFFWAFFHSSVSPSVSIGCIWPPLGIETLNPWGLPFLNTLILLSSGVTVTWAHRIIAVNPLPIIYSGHKLHDFSVVNYVYPKTFTSFFIFKKSISESILYKMRYDSILALILTVILGLTFTALQLFEYNSASFSINSGIYGSTFYVTTGFHGLHVIIGTIFLLVCLVRHINYHFSSEHHVGLECAIWYWHFVDVIWLLLFVSIYWWGS